MKKVRWGIIGAGGIADRRAIPALLLDERNEIVAVMDKNFNVSKAVAEKYSISKYYNDAETMLRDIQCDVVYVATPVFCHYEYAMLALKYNTHVFMEKPLAMNADESEKILTAFKEKGKLIAVGYMMPYHNLHITARNLVFSGKLGDIVSVRIQFSCWYPDLPGEWRQKKALGGGGCIIDLAVHCMDLLHSITGDEFEVYHTYMHTKTFSYEVEDSAVISFRTKGGILGHIDVNFNIPDAASPSKLEIYGTKGSIYAEGTLGQEEDGKLKFTYAPQSKYDALQKRCEIGSKNYYAKKGNLYLKQFQRFNKLITNGYMDYSSCTEAVKIQRICQDIYEHQA